MISVASIIAIIPDTGTCRVRLHLVNAAQDKLELEYHRAAIWL